MLIVNPGRHRAVHLRGFRITAPALIVHGTEDPLRPLPRGQALAAQIPRARLETIAGMGHGFFTPGLPRRISQIVLDHTRSAALAR